MFPGEITREEFDRKIEVISRAYNVLPLDYAVKKLQSGELPRKAVSITFDDGYADNHDIALPILEKWNVSATFFIATGFIDGGIMWNDRIIESIRLSNRQELDLSLLGLGRINICNNENKRHSIKNIIEKIKYLEPDEREKHIIYIENESGASLP
ncbi:MAG: polysaccharide deacetylase family protein, partial [Gammaproteobacteria bacterium]|nr:polysaccharide deacetylase family protein [Gammaproteobacteria bacterium]